VPAHSLVLLLPLFFPEAVGAHWQIFLLSGHACIEDRVAELGIQRVAVWDVPTPCARRHGAWY
jgi:hypothetical protein